MLIINKMAQRLTRNTDRLVGFISNHLGRFFHNRFEVYQTPILYNKKKHSKPIFITFKRWKITICWKCGVERQNISNVFCEKCNVVQHPHEENNYFKLFELEEKFDIDEQHLKNTFRHLQSILHPDKFSNRNHEEQTISADYSSLLNKAYSTLNAPLKRAEHLLELKGEALGENKSVDDPEFLIDIMSLNEEVEEAGKNVIRLKELNSKNKDQIKQISIQIAKSFNKNEFKRAKEDIIKFKYFVSLGNRINGMLRESGDTD